ncbi:surfactant protein Ba [Genypterus blacodes]|uniref:surfactant protein Ba n=1 Tax=Genypterus blacodes TaxID=154954 RepID=UPI003F773F6A
MKMASLQFFALFLFIGLHSSAGDFQMFPESPSNGDPCQDCTQIFKLLADLLSNAELQKKMIGEIESLCYYLPSPTYAQMCKAEVEKFFPLAITFITSIMKPEQVCTLLRLCGSPGEAEQLISSVTEALEAAMAQEKGEPATQCSFCILLLQTLEGLIPKEKTESAVLELMKHICIIVPASYRKECETIIHQYGKLVLEAIMKLASPQSICTLIHMCHSHQAPQDPCIMRTYMCRDYDTALKCATLPFCQRFVWNQN